MALQAVVTMSSGSHFFSSVSHPSREARRSFSGCSLSHNSGSVSAPRVPLRASSNCKTHLIWKRQQASKRANKLDHVQAVTEQHHPQESNQQTAGFLPTVWDTEVIMSTTTGYKYEDHAARLEQLKQNTRTLLESIQGKPHLQLKLIDEIQRLGLARHFEKEIKKTLNSLHLSSTVFHDLFSVALRFRLLRQNGLATNPEVFDKFLDANGEFMDNLKEDVKGLLSLYEASYLGLSGEYILEKAKNFSTRHLKLSSMGKMETTMSKQIQQSLKIPLYQRLPWLEARSFIDVYQRNESRSPVLLELAKLDYNLVQSVYLEELKELAKWWKDLNLKEKYPSYRDRLVESYFYSMGCVPQPQFSKCRKLLAKFAATAAVLDDMCESYQPAEELQMLTELLCRWDLNAIEDLPEQMRPCYLAIYEIFKEIVESSKALGMNIEPYINEHWAFYVRGYIQDAQWISSRFIPTFDEYRENGIASTSVSLCNTIIVFSTLDWTTITENNLLRWIERPSTEFSNIPSFMGRLHNDIQSAKIEMERGDVTNSITCFMVQEGVTEEEACDHLNCLISDGWTKLNDLIVTESLPSSFSEIALNNARCVQQMYKMGDFYSVPSQENINCVISSFFKPILMHED